MKYNNKINRISKKQKNKVNGNFLSEIILLRYLNKSMLFNLI